MDLIDPPFRGDESVDGCPERYGKSPIEADFSVTGQIVRKGFENGDLNSTSRRSETVKRNTNSDVDKILIPWLRGTQILVVLDQFYALELGKSGVVAALIVNNVLSSLTNDVCSKHDYCKHIRFSCIVSAFHVGWSYSSLKPLEQIQLL
ncbi:hypothetical protein ACS0TY_003668 [Phlomoides rotata]